MTRILHQDPDRRCKTLEEWPEADQRLWQATLVPGDLLEEGGSRARYTDNTNRGIVYGYGRFLQWLDRQGQLDLTNPPGDGPVPRLVLAQPNGELDPGPASAGAPQAPAIGCLPRFVRSRCQPDGRNGARERPV